VVLDGWRRVSGVVLVIDTALEREWVVEAREGNGLVIEFED
jgi:hypothetical protein